MNIKVKIILFVLFVNLVAISSTLFLYSYKLLTPGSQLFFGMLAGLFIVLMILTMVFAFYLLKPVDNLIIAAQLLAAGRYDNQLAKKTNDEFGRLIETFNSMSKKLKNSMARSRHYSDIAAQEKWKTNHIIDSMTGGVIVTDENYRVVLFNSTAEQMFDLDESKVKSKHILHIFEAFGMKEAKAKFPALDKHQVLPVKDVKPTIFEEEVEKPKRMILKVSIAPVLNDKRFPAGTVTVIDDITRRREIERMKSEFVSNVSHELRTPLTSILGYTHVLLSGKSGEIKEGQKKYLETIDQESKRLSNIIEDILDLSKLESGKAKIKFEDLDLREVLNSTQAINFPEKKGITLRVHAPENLPNVKGDRVKLTQVFNNLLSNAVKFTSKGGSITVKFTNHKESVQVDVIDTGVGVKKDDVKNLFNKFYQVKSNLTNKESGTGLGLSIVKEIIAAHYGLLGVDSTHGKGTKISFTLPKKEVKGSAEKVNCWEHLSCGKKNCPQYKISEGECWIELGTLCKKGRQEPCTDKIKVCSYCEVYRRLFKEDDYGKEKNNTGS